MDGNNFLTPVSILFHSGAMWMIQTLVTIRNLAQKEPHITGHAWLVKIEVRLLLTLPILIPFGHFTFTAN